MNINELALKVIFATPTIILFLIAGLITQQAEKKNWRNKNVVIGITWSVAILMTIFFLQ